MPLAVSPAAWLFRGGLHRSQLSDRCALSSSFAVLQSFAQHDLVSQPQPADSSHGLSLPTALEGKEIHCRGLCLGPLRSALRVWLPSRRLAPSEPCRPCFVPAALLGFALRSFLLPKGTRRVSAGVNPRTVSPVGDPAAEAVGRPNGPRFLGFHPFRSPWRPDGG